MINLPPETFNAKLPDETVTLSPLDPFVGHLSIEFNNLEFILQLTLQKLLNTDSYAAQAVWSSLMWSGRLDMIDALLDARFHKDELVVQFWRKRLKPFLYEIASDRNAVIHGMRSTVTQQDGSTEHFVTHNHFGDHGFARRRFRYGEAELREIILDIRLAVQIMSHFDRCLIGLEPTPEQLAQLSVRRRPPRGQREKG